MASHRITSREEQIKVVSYLIAAASKAECEGNRQLLAKISKKLNSVCKSYLQEPA